MEFIKSQKISETISASNSSIKTIKIRTGNNYNSVPLNNNFLLNYENKDSISKLNKLINKNNINKSNLKLLKNNSYDKNVKRPISSLVTSDETKDINFGKEENSNEILAKNKCLSVSQNMLINNKIKLNGLKAPIEKMSNIISSSLSYNIINNSCYNIEDNIQVDTFDDKFYKEKTNLNNIETNKSNLNNFNSKNNYDHNTKNKSFDMFFSSCSSCDTSSVHSTTLTKTTSTNSYKIEAQLFSNLNVNTKNSKVNVLLGSSNLSIESPDRDFIYSRYHSISIIFILIGLFTINCLQESFLIFYYLNTEQYYWFIYSVVAIFSGQVIILILSLLSELDLINTKKKTHTVYFKYYYMN